MMLINVAVCSQSSVQEDVINIKMLVCSVQIASLHRDDNMVQTQVQVFCLHSDVNIMVCTDPTTSSLSV